MPVKHIAQRLALGALLVLLQRAQRLLFLVEQLQAQVLRLDLPPFSQHQPPAHTVGQLAHIARPVMPAHRGQGMVAERTRPAPGFQAVEMGKVACQHGQVTMPVAQRRGHHLQHVQAVIQVFAKTPLLDGPLQVHMGGRQHSHIHWDRLAAAHPLDVLLLQKTQQVGLQLQRQVTDFIEKQRATMGRFDAPGLALMRPGECALFMAEQFGLDQMLGDRPTVDGDERLLAALRLTVQGACHQFLAGAALTTDQHGRFGGRQFAQQLAQLTDRPAFAEQLVGRLIDLDRPLAAQTGHAEGAAQGHLHAGDVERQGVEVEKPLTNKITERRHAQLFGAEHGNPFGVAALDHVLDRIRMPQVRGLQAQQAYIAGMVQRGPEHTAVHIPACVAQARQ